VCTCLRKKKKQDQSSKRERERKKISLFFKNQDGERKKPTINQILNAKIIPVF
jgi:hypothetical protein